MLTNSPARRRWFGILAATLAMLGRDRVAIGAPRPPSEIPPQVLAIPDTAETWIGERSAFGTPSAITLFVLWNPTDPSCHEMMPTIEAWHEAYARYGVRVVGIAFAREPSLRDSVVAEVAAARLGLKFASALSFRPPPAALLQERGPVVVLRDKGDQPAKWIGGTASARALEGSLRASLRVHRPDLHFPEDTGPSTPAEDSAPRWRRVGLAPGEVAASPLAGAKLDQAQPFTAQFQFQEASSNLVPVPLGWWIPRADRLEAARPGPANLIAIRYDAGPVVVMMAPPVTGSSRVWVLQDEHWILPPDAGEDVQFDPRGAAFVQVTEPRLYAIARGGRHVLKLSPDDPGVRFYAFHVGPAPAKS
ncbi:MAG TPA: hypothetical protein VMJ70_12130 [Candidatus Sulfotelmatobacter sp.]|nr:hypothetical protein [Candidatus Sulfotelmatobacter sp.]